MIVLNRISVFPKEINQLEKRLTRLAGKKYVFTSINATASLHAAIAALASSAKPKVHVNGLVIPSNYVGAVKEHLPVTASLIDEQTFNFDLKLLNENLQPNDIVIVTHYFGYTSHLDKLVELVRSKGAKLIEDCSHCHGGYYKGYPLGSFGDISVFSFQGAKFVSGGEGGCFATNDKILAELGVRHLYQDKYRARLKFHGLRPQSDLETFGLKGRMHPLAAALINPELKTLEFRNKLCRVIISFLTEKFPKTFIKTSEDLKLGGFANGILICNLDQNLKYALQNDWLIKKFIYERNYARIRKSLINEEQDVAWINRKIEATTLYMTSKVFTNCFVLLRLIAILKQQS